METDPKTAAWLLRRSVRGRAFERACLDTGASSSVVRREQTEAYARLSGERLVLAPPTMKTLLFGGKKHASMGTLPMHVPLSQAYCLPLLIDVIPLNVPLLIGLDVLDRYGLCINNV